MESAIQKSYINWFPFSPSQRLRQKTARSPISGFLQPVEYLMQVYNSCFKKLEDRRRKIEVNYRIPQFTLFIRYYYSIKEKYRSKVHTLQEPGHFCFGLKITTICHFVKLFSISSVGIMVNTFFPSGEKLGVEQAKRLSIKWSTSSCFKSIP